MSSLAQLALLLLGFASTPAPATQRVDTITLHVGSSYTNGRLLTPYRRRFLGYFDPCVYSGDSIALFVVETDQLELIASGADSSWLLITTSDYTDGRHDIDSTVYDHRTLAPRRARYGLRGAIGTEFLTGFDIQGKRVSWFDSVNTPPQHLDTTFAEPGFLEATAELLIESTPVLSTGHGVAARVPMVGVGANAPDFYYLYESWHYLHLSHRQRPPRLPAGSVAIQDGEATFWVDRASRRVVAKQSPGFEGTCPMTFLLQTP